MPPLARSLALGAALGALAGLSAAATRAGGGAPEGLAPGLYRLEMRQVHASRFAILGRTRTVFDSVSLARVTRGEEGWVQRHQICQVRFESGMPLVEMVMPPAMRESLVRPEYAVEVARQGEALRYRADLGLEHVGYVPQGDPLGELPRRRDDPAVVDSDGDGKPGATLHLDVPVLDPLELYVVQRGHVVLDGEVKDDGRVEGALRSDLEQVVIASDPYFLKRSPELEPDAERSRFVMTPVAADSTCDTLVSADAAGDG